MIKFHKVTIDLPDPIEKNSLYAVRSGDGFDLYLTDDSGSFVFRVNDNTPEATSSELGGVKLGYVPDGKKYPVKVDGSGNAYVEVPWISSGGSEDPKRVIYNVKEYGAVGDGETDDTAAIQDTINAAAGKGIVIIPEGEYLVTASANTMPFPSYGGIRIPSNSHVILDPGAVIQVAPNGLSKYYCFSIYESENIILEGGTIIGDRTTHTYPNYFNSLEDMQNGIYFTKDNYNPDPPTWPNGALGYIIEGPDIGTYEYQDGTWSLVDPTLTNYVTHEWGEGVGIENSRNVHIRDCVFKEFTGEGIIVQEGDQLSPTFIPVDDISITGCTFIAHRRQGISIIRGMNIKIDNCTFHDIGIRMNMQDGCAPRAGIDIESGSQEKPRNVSVTNSRFMNCLGGSVNMFDGNNVIVSHNVAEDGISYAYATNSIIANNVILKNGISGNGPHDPSPFTWTQTGTTITGVTADPNSINDETVIFLEFMDSSDYVLFTGYFLVTYINSTTFTVEVGEPFDVNSGNGYLGFRVLNNIIIGNHLVNDGIWVHTSGIKITGNTLRHGNIVLSSDSYDITIDNNNIQNGCIRSLGGTENIRILNNCIEDSYEFRPIILPNVTDTVVQGNIIRRSGRGINVSGEVNIEGNFIDNTDTGFYSPMIELEGSTSVINFSNNTLVATNCSEAIYVESPNTIVKNNTITNFGGSTAILVTGSDASGTKVLNNYIETGDTNTTAISLNDGAMSCLVADNETVDGTEEWSSSIVTFVGSSSKFRNNVLTVAPSYDPGDVIEDSLTNITGLVSAGSNITLTGTGAKNDPFVISGSAVGGGSGANQQVLGNITGAKTIDLNNEASTEATATLTGNTTLSFTNVPAGKVICTLFIRQDATGDRTLSFPANSTMFSGQDGSIDSDSGSLSVITMITMDQGSTWHVAVIDSRPGDYVPYTPGDGISIQDNEIGLDVSYIFDGFDKIMLVDEEPVSPVAGVVYLIKE